jgi:hypothetical protein
MAEKKIGRPASKDPKNIQMRIRLTENENQMLEECSQKLNVSKSAVFIMGMKKVYADIKK